MSKKKKLIFCNECVHFHNFMYQGCKKFEVEEITPYEKLILLGDCDKLNKNNDCKGFEPIIKEPIKTEKKKGFFKWR